MAAVDVKNHRVPRFRHNLCDRRRCLGTGVSHYVTLHGIHYIELDDGAVRRARGFFDLYDAATQLGLLPTRGGMGEAALLLLRGFGVRRRPI